VNPTVAVLTELGTAPPPRPFSMAAARRSSSENDAHRDGGLMRWRPGLHDGEHRQDRSIPKRSMGNHEQLSYA
jgi:hypothetical protein